jgi:hypothetical protein
MRFAKKCAITCNIHYVIYDLNHYTVDKKENTELEVNIKRSMMQFGLKLLIIDSEVAFISQLYGLRHLMYR